jgi:hypothetical protein
MLLLLDKQQQQQQPRKIGQTGKVRSPFLWTLLSRRHTLHLFTKRAPVIRLEFSILDSFLRPLLMETTNVILGFLEEEEFVTDAFADEDAAGVLLDNGFLVLDSQS